MKVTLPRQVHQLQVPPELRKARDFTVCHELCGHCRGFLKRWPGWPRDDRWHHQAYPGDIALTKEDDYFRKSVERRAVNRQFDCTSHPQLRTYSGINPIFWLAYHECELCALIHATLSETTPKCRSLDINMLMTSTYGVNNLIQGGAGSWLNTSTVLSLDPAVSGDVRNDLPSGSPGSRAEHQSLTRVRENLKQFCMLRRLNQVRTLPTRLVEVTKTVGEHAGVRVVSTNSLRGSPSYLTLSHQWGQESKLLLTKSNRKVLERSIAWHSIPRTYQDALQVTLELGYSYIWIDSLCIIQDSQADWEQESLQMSEIYSATTLNIFADCASDDDSGFLSSPRRPASPGLKLRLDWPGMAGRSWNCELSHESIYRYRHVSSDNSHLKSRGWVVQEELLPPAIVHFGGGEVFWTCIHGSAAENSPLGRHTKTSLRCPPEPRLAGQIRMKQFFQRYENADGRSESLEIEAIKEWNTVIERYNACELSFESDKLVAISGIAQAMCKASNLRSDDYLAGMWRPFFLTQLGWIRAEGRERRKTLTEHSTYVAPSWSWASLKGDIETCNFRVIGRHALAELIAAEVKTQGSPFGMVLNGHVTVQAPLWAIHTIVPETDAPVSHYNSSFIMQCGCSVPNENCVGIPDFDGCEIIFDAPARHKGPDQPSPLFFMCIYLEAICLRVHDEEEPSPSDYGDLRLTGLMLQRNTGEVGEYRRVGTVRASLKTMVHGGCSGRELLQDHYLAKTAGCETFVDAIQKSISANLSMEDFPCRVSSYRGGDSHPRVKSAVDWEARGDIKWPVVYLKPPERCVMRDPLYTIRIT